jgi:O-antigen ligase
MFFVGALPIMPPQEISLDPVGGPLVTKWINITQYLVLSILIVRHPKGVIYAGTRSIPLLFLLGLIQISILWSADPQQTLLYSKGMLRTFLLGAYLSWQYSIKEQMWMLSWALGITALLSLVLCLFFPFYGVHQSLEWSGAWCGVYGHKNELGYYMALGAGIFLHLALSNQRYWLILWSGFTLSLSLIVFSRSTTAVGILLALIILLFIYKLMQKNQYKLQIIFINIAILLIISGTILLSNNVEILVATQGKDLTLSGRTPMWLELIDKIAQNPFLGYGFFGFWNSTQSLDIRAKYPWAGNSHNGFIDLGLDLGLLGFILFTISFLQFFLKALRRLVLIAKKWEDFWPMQFLVFLVMINSSEARLIIPTTNFLLYVTILLSLTLESRRMRKTGDYRIAMENKSG